MIEHSGSTSLSFRMTAHCGEQKSFETAAWLVHVDRDGKPSPWPDVIKAKLAALQKT